MARRCLLAALLSCVPLFGQRPTDSYNGSNVAANQVIVRFRSATPALVQQFAQIIDADQVRQLGGTTGPHLFHSKSKAIGVLMPLLAGTSAADFVEPDYILQSTAVPNDPNYPSLWGLHNTSKPGADISAQAAWDVSTGSAANVVGVIDTGVDYNHPDLAANMWSAPAAFTVNLSFGSVTCPAGSHGFNAITRSCNPADDHGHGTHVSGTIGAVGNNAAGVTGVNWTTRIMGLKFLDSTGNGSTSDAIDAMEFAIQVKAAFAGTGTPVNLRVFSNSWGGAGFSQSLLDEINKANTNNILFVAAAGNAAVNIDTLPFYPASFQAPNMVAVAATDINDALANFSNFGANSVHLGAPGVSILSTYPNAAYAYASGTSMATPHVSGAAMLLLSTCTMTTAALKAALLNNVDAIPALTGKTTTGGRLNVNKAIRSCASPAPVSVTPSSGSGSSQTFGFVYADPQGYAAISSVSGIINSTLSGAGACYFLYYRGTNLLYLANDASSAWSTPIALGQSGSLVNSQCTVDVAGSSVSGSGNNLTLNLALTFQPAFSGARKIYMEVYDGADSGWLQKGTWTVPGASLGPVSVTPSSGSGSSQTFSFVYGDPQGYAAISSVSGIINSTLSGAGGCYFLYYRGTNLLYLANDASSAWLTPATLGQNGSLVNSQCTVNLASSSVSGSGNNLTLNLALTFQSSFGGVRKIYMEVYDGADSGWLQKGTWTVPGALLGPVSVTPGSGSGSSQIFNFVYGDPQGYAAISSVSGIINSTLSGAGGCYFLYYRGSNLLYLANDASSAWLTPATLGQNGSLVNSQCTVNLASSSVSGSGNNLTLNLVLSFLPVFQGARNIYMEVYDGNDSGWSQKGTWTVP